MPHTNVHVTKALTVLFLIKEKLLIVLGKNEGFILEVQKYRLKAFENFV